MRTTTVIIFGGLLVGLLSTGCQQPSTAEDFNGAWRGTGTAITSTGSGTSHQEWALDADPTGRLTATNVWRIAEGDDRHGLTHDGRKVQSDTEHLIGMIDFDDHQFVLVETQENGTIFGELLPDGRLRLVRSQPGSDSVVMMTTLTRTAR